MLPGVVARESRLVQAGVDGTWSGRYGEKLHTRGDSRINNRAASPSPETKGPSMWLCEGSCDHIPAPPLPVMSPRVTEGFLLPCFGGGAHCPTGPPKLLDSAFVLTLSPPPCGAQVVVLALPSQCKSRSFPQDSLWALAEALVPCSPLPLPGAPSLDGSFLSRCHMVSLSLNEPCSVLIVRDPELSGTGAAGPARAQCC